jgi:hypothetical protein
MEARISGVIVGPQRASSAAAVQRSEASPPFACVSGAASLGAIVSCARAGPRPLNEQRQPA